MKRLFLALLSGLMILTAVGCGTIKGIGEDISAIGGWLTKGSDTVVESVGK